MCGNLSTCYKFSSAALSLASERTRTRYEARIFRSIIYARLARSRRKSSSVYARRKERKTKRNVSLILAPVTDTVHVCSLALPRLSFSLANSVWKIPHVVLEAWRAPRADISSCVVSMFTFHVLGNIVTEPLEIIIREAILKRSRDDFTICDVSEMCAEEKQHSTNWKSESFVLRNVNYKKLMCPHNSTICLRRARCLRFFDSLSLTHSLASDRRNVIESISCHLFFVFECKGEIRLSASFFFRLFLIKFPASIFNVDGEKLMTTENEKF